MPSNVVPLHPGLHLKQTFPPIIQIFNEGDEIESKLPFKIFSTLIDLKINNISNFDQAEKKLHNYTKRNHMILRSREIVKNDGK